MAAQKNQRGIRIPEDVKAFAKMDYKKFKKKNISKLDKYLEGIG